MRTSTPPKSSPSPRGDGPSDPALCRCGAAPTAFKRNPVTGISAKCLSCAAVDRYQLAPHEQRNLPMPEHIRGTPIAQIHPQNSLWNHQTLTLASSTPAPTWSSPPPPRPARHSSSTSMP